MEQRKLRDFSAERGFQRSPHQNGCAEASAKCCKRALKKAIGEHVFTPFDLYTCLLEVSFLINQHPIGRIPNDSDDGSYLCPNDMLLGRASAQVPQGPFKARHQQPPPSSWWNLCKELWTPSGKGAQETCFHR